MLVYFLALFAFSFSTAQEKKLEAVESFKFHLVSEPGSLKPWEQKNSSSGYLLSQLVGTLLSYQAHELTGNLAETCSYKKKMLVECVLKKNLKWSNGKAIEAKHFISGFKALINPANKAPQADLLFPIKNAKAIFTGRMPVDSLKIKSTQRGLEFELESPDSEFLFNLTSPLLSPLPDSEIPNISQIASSPQLWISSGPYKIELWEPQKKIKLLPNTNFWKVNKRPPIEIYTISEDSVALNLYEKGELSFLRRLPTVFIPKYKDREDFHFIEQFRFDYLGFSSKWREALPLRRALSKAINYSDLQSLYHSQGKPGCPGIPSHLLQEVRCIEYDLVEAISEWQNLHNKPNKFEIIYSRQGGDDHKRSMEWLQSEFKKNLKFNSDLTGIENQLFIERLEKKTPDLFRKGISPSRPTCLSALEAFGTGNAENYIQFSHPRFDEILETLKNSQELSLKKKLCSEAVGILLNESWIIPTGPIHFAILVSTKWRGWKLNELNQLDLSEVSN